MPFLFLVTAPATAAEDVGIHDEIDLNVITSSMMSLLVFLPSLGALVFAPARQVLDWQDHHTFRTNRLRKLRVFAPTEAAVGKDKEEIGDKEEREDRQHIENVDGYCALGRGFSPRFDYLRHKVSRRTNT